MIPFYHKSSGVIRNLAQLIQAQSEHGGTIVRFQLVLSGFVLSRKTSHFVWVPPNGSRVLRSLPYTIPTMLFGWWSLFGFFWTIEALYSNLCGGCDVTSELMEATSGNAEVAQQAVEHQIRAKRRQSLRALAQFSAMAAVFAGIGLYAHHTDHHPARRTAVSGKFADTGSPAAATTAVSQAMRLQSIFYSPNPNRSSAVINGQSVMVGDRAGGYTLRAVNPKSVTLQSSGGQMLTLNLPADR